MHGEEEKGNVKIMNQRKLSLYLALFAGWYAVLAERAFALRASLMADLSDSPPAAGMPQPMALSHYETLVIQYLPWALIATLLGTASVAAAIYRYGVKAELYWRGWMYALVAFHTLWILLDPTRPAGVALEWLDVFALCIITVYAQHREQRRKDALASGGE